MMCGYRIRRSAWNSLHYYDKAGMPYSRLVTEDVLADDWEIITESIVNHMNIVYSDEEKS